MNRRMLLISLACLAFGAHSIAQDTKKKFEFQSLNQFGLLKGASKTKVLFQSINGFQYNSWFAGIGVGLDEYYFSSVPLFIDIKRNLPQNLKSFFLYADGGWNFSLEKNRKEAYGSLRNKGGCYYDVGFGYQKPLHRNLRFLSSIGYTKKILGTTQTGYTYYLYEQQPQFNIVQRYHLSRLSFKVGLAF